MPVWQNVQLSVQPTWLETQSVPRSDSGNIDAFDLGALVAAVGGGHAEQPFARAVGGNLLGDDFGARQRMALGEPIEQRAGDVAHRGKLARAAMVDPVPELRDAHVALALGHAEVGKRAGELGSRRAREAHRRAVLGGRMRRGSWRGF